MHNFVRSKAGWVVGLGLLMFASGCFSVRTSNQGGGSLVTAGSKLAGGNVGDLNPDEWQILVDNLPLLSNFVPQINLSGVNIPTLSDDDAAAIVTFLDDNNVQTFDDLENLENAELPPALQALAEAFMASNPDIAEG